MPSPPEQIKAKIRGSIYDLEEDLLSVDFLLIPEMIIIGIIIDIPKNPKNVICSFQKIAPDKVGIKNPKE